MGRHIDAVMAAVSSGQIVGERAVLAMAERTIEADRAERGGRPVRALVASAELTEDEYSSLWPPVSRAEAERREWEHQRRIAASRPVDDDGDELYYAIFPEARRR